MKQIAWQSVAAASEIVEKVNISVALLEMINSDKYTHAEKRKIAYTARCVLKELVANVIKDDNEKDDLPF